MYLFFKVLKYKEFLNGERFLLLKYVNRAESVVFLGWDII